MFSGKHKSCNYSKLLMKHPGGKRALLRGPLPQIQTKTECNTFQNEDDEVPCYFNRTNQDAYFHPAYQDGRDPCWKWRNKALCNEKKKNRWRKLQSAKENSVFCSLSEDKFPQCQTLLVLVLLQLLKRKIFQLIKMLVYIYRTNIVAYVNTNIHPQVTTGQVKKE